MLDVDLSSHLQTLERIADEARYKRLVNTTRLNTRLIVSKWRYEPRLPVSGLRFTSYPSFTSRLRGYEPRLRSSEGLNEGLRGYSVQRSEYSTYSLQVRGSNDAIYQFAR